MHEGFLGPEVRYIWKRTGKLETGDHENVLAQIGLSLHTVNWGEKRSSQTTDLKSTPAVQGA